MFQLERRQQLIILIITAVILFGGGYKYACWQKNNPAESKVALEQFEEQLETLSGAEEKKTEIMVHVTGAVEKSGVYRLPANARVNDAVKKAGIQAEANLDGLNLAAPLIDGQKIIVPLKQDLNLEDGKILPGQSGAFTSNMTGNTSGGNQAAPDALININTADQAALENLPGIGPALAQRIIQYREKNGLFKTPEDIKNVAGIGEKRFENLKDLITIY